MLLSTPPLTININDLNEDVLVEILSRLTIKGLVRSQSVSKLWYRPISTICIPNITKIPVNTILFNICSFSPVKKKGPWSLVKVNSPMHVTSLRSLRSMLPFTPTPNEFFDCCNGVFLFYDRSLRQYYVCNPATEQCFPIPNSPDKPLICGALIFDPHYKVVHISKLSPFTMNIFSSETREWTEHILHLVPSTATRRLMIGRTIALDGSLYMLSGSGYETRVWILDEDSQANAWILKKTICHKHFAGQLLCNNPCDPTTLLVFSFDPTSDILFLGNHRGIYRYHPCSKRLECLCRLQGSMYVCAGQYIVYPFSPTLTTLDASTQKINKEPLEYGDHRNLENAT